MIDKLRGAIRVDRLMETAAALVGVPSPTGNAGACADRLAEILSADGFEVERPTANWPNSPAVVARYRTGKPGKTLQFNGHIDTVHLPFVPPRVEGDRFFGSGSCDMKSGVAVMVEAVRALRDSGTLPGGELLLTAHDLHEAPWGDNRQLEALIDEGFVGDGVLIPEYFCDCIPLVGRGLMVFEVMIRREGEPVHEVLGGLEQPSVIRAGAELVRRLSDLDARVASRTHPQAGRESVFIGKLHAGEIYNQSPVELELQGTRRWLAGTQSKDVETGLRNIFADVQAATGTRVDAKLQLVRDAFEMAGTDRLIDTLQSAHAAVHGRTLPFGAKMFVDDANTFVSRAGVPAITHGPGGRGAHTLHEEVSIAALERTALVYALTAIEFCKL